MIWLEADEYPVFGFFNRDVIKPTVKEINDLINYLVEVEQKCIRRKVAGLKFYIAKFKQTLIQESLFQILRTSCPSQLNSSQAEIDRKIALQIAEQEWNFVNPQKLPQPGIYPDFTAYIAEKIEMSLHIVDVKSRRGFIVETICENYQDSEVKRMVR